MSAVAQACMRVTLPSTGTTGTGTTGTGTASTGTASTGTAALFDCQGRAAQLASASA
jgi:hypothetical protein